MIRNLKALGLALVALFAMSAMTASMAGAHTPADFDVETSAAEPVTITGTQKTEHTFEITSRTITCDIVAFEGTTNNPTPTSIKMAAFYDECFTDLGTEAEITNFAVDHSEIGQAGKCWYRLDADGTAALECNNADVTIDAQLCIVHIPAQQFANAVSYSTEEDKTTKKHDLTVSFDVNGVTANHTDGFLCPFNGSAHGATANFHGTSTAFAELESNGALRHLTHTPTVP